MAMRAPKLCKCQGALTCGFQQMPATNAGEGVWVSVGSWILDIIMWHFLELVIWGFLWVLWFSPLLHQLMVSVNEINSQVNAILTLSKIVSELSLLAWWHTKCCVGNHLCVVHDLHTTMSWPCKHACRRQFMVPLLLLTWILTNVWIFRESKWEHFRFKAISGKSFWTCMKKVHFARGVF